MDRKLYDKHRGNNVDGSVQPEFHCWLFKPNETLAFGRSPLFILGIRLHNFQDKLFYNFLNLNLFCRKNIFELLE